MVTAVPEQEAKNSDHQTENREKNGSHLIRNSNAELKWIVCNSFSTELFKNWKSKMRNELFLSDGQSCFVTKRE
jgi:hypothetical protein